MRFYVTGRKANGRKRKVKDREDSLDGRSRYRLQIHCGRKEFPWFTKKEQSSLLRHGLTFLREGRLTPIGHRAMPISKVRREGSAVFQVRPLSPVPLKKKKIQQPPGRQPCAICISRYEISTLLHFILREIAQIEYTFKLDFNSSGEKFSHEEGINLNYAWRCMR